MGDRALEDMILEREYLCSFQGKLVIVLACGVVGSSGSVAHSTASIWRRRVGVCWCQLGLRSMRELM